MADAATGIFWLSLIIVFYTYIGYPLVLMLLVAIRKIFSAKTRPENTALHEVTLIVAAYNEQDIIEEKIKNTLGIDYPSPLLKVIFVTDGSTDATNAIIAKYPQLMLLHEPQRKGKLAAINRAMSHVQTPFVIFSDANGFLNPGCIKSIMRHYACPNVGGVTGEKKVTGRNGAVGEGEGLYWRYESLLKRLDSDLNTVVGAAGELFSLRTGLYTLLNTDVIIEDFVQSLMLCRKGYKVRYERAAYSEERPSSHIRDEMERKIRISAGGFQAMVLLKELFNIFRYPLTGFQFISHRVLRWTITPVALVSLLISSMILYAQTGNLWYGAGALAQVLFYLAALIGWKQALNHQKQPLFYLPFYFSFMNFCVFAGFYRYIRNRQSATWTKAVRTGKI